MKEYLIPPTFCKALIFDLDGTLADTMPLHLESWQMIGSKYGVPITDQMINDRAGTPTKQVAEQLNADYGWALDPIIVYRDKNHFYDVLQSRARPILSISEVFDVAQQYLNKLPMAIGTGSTRADAQLAIDDLNIQDWFPVLVTADEVTHGKPHPETYLKCAAGLGIPPEQCVVYEDGPKGIESALNAGMNAINIVTHQRHILELENHTNE